MKRHCGTCEFYSSGSRCQNAMSAEYSRYKFTWDRCAKWEISNTVRIAEETSETDKANAQHRKTGDTSN